MRSHQRRALSGTDGPRLKKRIAAVPATVVGAYRRHPTIAALQRCQECHAPHLEVVMKLHFSSEELKLIADILLNQGDPAGLLERIMTNDLTFDFAELDQLRETLVASWTNATREVAACPDPQAKKKLEAQQATLESMIDRVTETCAMF
jgi:hypothetical protein